MQITNKQKEKKVDIKISARDAFVE